MGAPSRRRLVPDQLGAAAVEFALVVIPLLLIVFGIVNFGFIFASQISMNSAARDAARAGVVQQLGGSGLNCAEVAILARSSGGSVGVPQSKIAVTVTGPGGSCSLAENATPIAANVTPAAGAASQPCDTSSAGSQLVVELKYDYTAPVGLVPPTSLKQTATGSFQCEYA